MVILLDIDGVMIPAMSWKKPDLLNDGFFSFNSKAVKNLQKIVSETGASIIITSSHKSNYNIQEWEKIFKNRGIQTTITKLDNNNNYLSRKDEVLSWFIKNRTENFVIIDDDKSLNDLSPAIKEKLVLTSAYIGLSGNDARLAISILKKSRLSLV